MSSFQDISPAEQALPPPMAPDAGIGEILFVTLSIFAIFLATYTVLTINQCRSRASIRKLEAEIAYLNAAPWNPPAPAVPTPGDDNGDRLSVSFPSPSELEGGRRRPRPPPSPRPTVTVTPPRGGRALFTRVTLAGASTLFKTHNRMRNLFPPRGRRSPTGTELGAMPHDPDWDAAPNSPGQFVSDELCVHGYPGEQLPADPASTAVSNDSRSSGTERRSRFHEHLDGRASPAELAAARAGKRPASERSVSPLRSPPFPELTTDVAGWPCEPVDGASGESSSARPASAGSGSARAGSAPARSRSAGPRAGRSGPSRLPLRVSSRTARGRTAARVEERALPPLPASESVPAPSPPATAPPPPPPHDTPVSLDVSPVVSPVSTNGTWDSKISSEADGEGEKEEVANNHNHNPSHSAPAPPPPPASRLPVPVSVSVSAESKVSSASASASSCSVGTVGEIIAGLRVE